jgi:predicted MFS family arabinose efflux permease
MLTVYAIVKPAPLLGIAAGVLAVAFLVRESTRATPLVPLRLFRSRNVSGANLIQALTAAGMFGVFFLGALYVRRVLHYDALEIGLAFFLVTVLMGTLSIRYTEKFITRFGVRRTVRAGIILIGAAMLWFSRAPAHGTYVVDVLPTMVLLGIGCGVCFPSLMTLAMSGATPADAGVASGLVSTTAQVGGALGLAVLASVATSHAHGSHTLSAIFAGYHTAFLIGTILVVAAMAVALIVLKDPADRRHNQPSRQAILRAAYAPCSERSYEGTSIEAIATRAGVGKQTIHRWWPSKRAVIMEALNEVGRDGSDFPDIGDASATSPRR